MAGPLILGFEQDDLKPHGEDINSWKELPEHRDEGQVQLDVDRSFIYYPNGTTFIPEHILKRTMT
jgi:hypothetical protein